MLTPRPSLLPATIATVVAVVQADIGHELASVILGVANVAAATILAVLGQRLRRSARSLGERRMEAGERRERRVQSERAARKPRKPASKPRRRVGN